METGLRGPSSGALARQMERLFQYGTVAGLSEGELLERFVQGNDEAAFEAIVTRHGPMVLGVCRRLLRDPNDVDDAFQATFLVLVRKAGTLRRRELVGSWLYGVAFRVAKRARVEAARRAARTPFGSDPLEQQAAGDALDREPIPWLHEEVRRLPEKYRALVLLCYFEGLSHEEAAHRLGCPIGTVKGRLSRARELLRKRLIRRGVSLPAGELSLAMTRVAVPEPLKAVTFRAARAIVGAAGASTLTLPVANLVDGVLRAMIFTHARHATVSLLMAGILTTGAVVGTAQVTPRRVVEPEKETPVAITRGTTGPTADGDNPIAEKGGTEATNEEPDPELRRAEDRVVWAVKMWAKGYVSRAQLTEEENSLKAAQTKHSRRKRSRRKGAAKSAPKDEASPKKIAEPVARDQVSHKTDAASNRRPPRPINDPFEFQNRVAIAGLATAISATEEDPLNQAVMKKLDRPMTMTFAHPTPLKKILEFIKSSLAQPEGKPVPIYIDPTVLEQEGGSPLEWPVTIELEGVPLKTTLRLVLKQCSLAYCVRDGVLMIGSVVGIREELAEAVNEARGKDPKSRVQVMQSATQMMGGMGGMGGGGMGMM